MAPRGKYKTLLKDGKNYLDTRYDLFRLELLEKTSTIVAMVIVAVIVLLLLGSVWVYISCILIVLMEQAFGSFIPAFLIMGGATLLIMGFLLLFRKKLVLNPLIRSFSTIIFDRYLDDDDDDDDDEDEENEYDEDDDEE
ncbi:MAG: hypothetical protein LBQ60_06290 [Bacteroidales bacterium]|jgi:hypothetical protein|nr:hypothetical protein [Bacteroidales bacterium]